MGIATSAKRTAFNYKSNWRLAKHTGATQDQGAHVPTTRGRRKSAAPTYVQRMHSAGECKLRTANGVIDLPTRNRGNEKTDR